MASAIKSIGNLLKGRSAAAAAATAMQSPSNPAVDTLKSYLQDTGLTLDDLIFDQHSTPDQYSRLNSQWQTRGGKIYPLAYLVPNTANEIQKAVICGKRLGIRVVPKCGGHGFTKYAFGDSNTLVVDLRRLNQVTVDPNGENATATVGAGTRQGKLVYDIWAQGGFTTIIGDCPAVGVSGFALGGGKGTLNRHFGLLAENIVEMEMVDAEGRLLTASEDINPDLFWALRGAGASGSFGIVTKLKIRVFDAPAEIVTYTFEYDFDQFPQVFAAFQSYATTDIKTSGMIKYGTDMKIVIRFDEIFYGDRSHVTSELERIIQMFPPTKHISQSQPTPYDQWIMEKNVGTYGNYVKPNIQVTKPSDLILIEDGIGEAYHKRRSFLGNRALSTDEISRLYQLYKEVTPDVTGWIEAYGGKINQVRPEDTSFVHRNALYLICVRYEGATEDPSWLPKANYFMEKAKEIVGDTGTYPNYVDDDLENYLEEYYGKNLQRLVEIKRKYDPDNFFNNPQSIPVQLP